MTGKPRYVGRFAPSPTGHLHFGSLLAALASWLRARRLGGEWLVRLEDIDPPRERAGAAAHILKTLAQFGLASDRPVLYQSLRYAQYRDALAQLDAQALAFPCWCSRAALGAAAHRGRCAVRTSSAVQPAWRLLVPDIEVEFLDGVFGRQSQQVGREVGDFVLWRREDLPAYHLAVVVDDAAQGVTEVVRGADLLDSTPRQILLQRLLGLPAPDYLHIPLALDADGQKLSKQTLAEALDPAAICSQLRKALAFLGQAVESFDADTPTVLLRQAAAAFDPRRIPVRLGFAV